MRAGTAVLSLTLVTFALSTFACSDSLSLDPGRGNGGVTVAVTPTALDLRVGARANLVGTVRDKDGRVVPGRTITWKTNNAGIAQVSTTGEVTGIAMGVTVVIAKSGSDSARVRV